MTAVRIKTKQMDYDKVLTLPRPAPRMPLRPNGMLRALVRLLTAGDLKDASFSYTTDGVLEREEGPFLILMNHSSFIDLEMVFRIFAREPFCIVCTSDGFVGKEELMRRLGCIPTQKFVSDVTLIAHMEYALKQLKTSVLLYPEASYSFDGCQTPLPRKLGVLLKKLGVPVITVMTRGAFSRDPLYNCLQKRKVAVSAEVRCLATRQQIRELPARELTRMVEEAFVFDNFAWQYENKVAITEPFRADGLNRILYKCACCGAEGQMAGKGTGLTCGCCGKHYEMDPLGRLHAAEGETEFPHIPDWYAWERSQVRKALEDGSYRLDTEVDIGMMVDFKAIYMVGRGRLIHDTTGFHLTGCGGRLDYHQEPLASYGLYADYYWYELGDVICIGDKNALYYCFPRQPDVVARTRIAAEELYRLRKKRPAREA